MSLKTSSPLGIGDARSPSAPDRSFDPALLLESGPDLFGDFLCGILGSALNLGAAAVLSVRFHPAADEESSWVAGGNEAYDSQRTTRRFASA